MSEELITVTAQIPRSRIGDYYQMVASLNHPTLPSPRPSSASVELRPWGKGDEDLAKQLFTMVSPVAQKFLHYLANRPDQGFLVSELAAILAVEKGRDALAGALGPVGIFCKRFGRTLPYDTQHSAGTTAGFFIMSKEVAAIFRLAVNEV